MRTGREERCAAQSQSGGRERQRDNGKGRVTLSCLVAAIAYKYIYGECSHGFNCTTKDLAFKHFNVYYIFNYMYRILLSKRPWALEIHRTKNGGGRLHRQAVCMYNAYVRTP